MEFDALSHHLIGCALEVHKELGPGLLESAYQQCLEHELRLAGIEFRAQQTLPVVYKGLQLDCGYRLDIEIQNQLIVELKSVEQLLPIHDAQLMTYLKLSKVKTGLLINFSEVLLKDGIRRIVM
ncbi:MAG: GxxExxY protein [Candidatus Hydrogenedentes bacterium]|nr:GxxExxY protein [Candidatus Hydrogenedentota bacterium]